MLHVIQTNDPNDVRLEILHDLRRRRGNIKSSDRFGEVDTELSRMLDEMITFWTEVNIIWPAVLVLDDGGIGDEGF